MNRHWTRSLGAPGRAWVLGSMLAGCTTYAESSPAPRAPTYAELLVAGRRALGLGQSLVAEQYLKGALAAGAPSDIVVPLAIEACLAGGRLRSALSHVDDALARDPDNKPLLDLARELRRGLSL